jgi:DNA-binding transcriptional LysR family regulator
MPVSTVSRRVAALERRIGLALLVRSTRAVELTPVGATYLARCEAIVDAAEAAHAELGDHAANPRGVLRVSMTADFSLTFLTPLFAEFSHRYPELTFDFDLSPRVVDLIAEGFDVAIRMGELPSSQLTARKLGLLEAGLYAAPSYLAQAPPLTAPADLAGHACLRVRGVVTDDATWSLSRGRERREVPIRGRFVANSLRFVLELAALGLGVIAIDRAIARPHVEAGRLVRVLPAWSPPAIAVHALTPSRLLPAKTKLFLDCLSAHLKVDPPR